MSPWYRSTGGHKDEQLMASDRNAIQHKIVWEYHSSPSLVTLGNAR